MLIEQDRDYLYYPPEFSGVPHAEIIRSKPDPWKMPVKCPKSATISELFRSDLMSILARRLYDLGAPSNTVVPYQDLYKGRGRGGSLVDVIYAGKVYRAIGCKIYERKII